MTPDKGEVKTDVSIHEVGGHLGNPGLACPSGGAVRVGPPVSWGLRDPDVASVAGSEAPPLGLARLVVPHVPGSAMRGQSTRRRSALESLPRPATEGSRYLVKLRAFPTGRKGLRDGEGRVDGASALAPTSDSGLDMLDGGWVLRGDQAVDMTRCHVSRVGRQHPAVDGGTQVGSPTHAAPRLPKMTPWGFGPPSGSRSSSSRSLWLGADGEERPQNQKRPGTGRGVKVSFAARSANRP